MSAPWMKQALVGVDRAPSFQVDSEVAGLLDAVLAQSDDPALAFSRAAGIMTACRLAAVTLDPAVTPPVPAVGDAGELTQEHPWFPLLGPSFVEGPVRLQHEICERVAAIRACLPAPLLPVALDAGKRSQTLRTALLAAIGQRGRWLAQFNSAWQFAVDGAGEVDASNDRRLWDEGSLAQRVDYLRRQRAIDAAQARDLLQAQFGELPAKERLELVAVLAQELGKADETLLASLLLKDRSRDVRQLAARLLAQLPQSAHAQQLVAWLQPLLAQKRGLLGRSWQCDAPTQADPAWASAAIDATRPQHDSLGERAWWLYQLVRQVPLSWWTSHTGMNAAELLAWAAKGDWKAALYRGWHERVDAADRDWIEAMLASRDREFGYEMSGLLAMLPMAAREKHWPRTLDQLSKDGTLVEIVASCALGETLSADFSRALLADLHTCVENDRLRYDFGLRAQLPELAALMHPDALAEWRSPSLRGDETPAQAESIREFERVAAVRRTLHAHHARPPILIDPIPEPR
ncbi:DUF5691 domain-containing protein [Dyella subtropica]|uniref:DUF5691 domain-containing protein n=1 Tax=Dyella subtropica TaxID=2992127 RepID=UPI002259658D|nr:DUF5691 domain-containing protein [Dyella subtropica]